MRFIFVLAIGCWRENSNGFIILCADCGGRFVTFLNVEERFISFRLELISEAVRSLGELDGLDKGAGVGVIEGSFCSCCCSSFCFARLK